jgi:predicted Zn-dependent protease
MLGAESADDQKALAGVEISSAEERQMGQQVVGAFLATLKQRKIAVVSRGADVQYLRELVKLIQPLMANGKRYAAITVYLAESPECEARSFPGGTIVFFRGLLKSAGSEAALVGVAGHELSHLDRGHLLVRARRVKLAQQTFAGKQGAVSFEQFWQAGTTLAQVWMRPFRPQDEAEADSDGARWAYRAGYDPREMGKLFLLFAQRFENQRQHLPEFMQSHPDPKSRYAANLKIYQQCEQSDPQDRLYIGKENLKRLKRRIPRSQREFAE